MPDLPHLDQLRRQAKDLRRAAKRGVPEAPAPVNEPDAEWGRLPLHTAAANGRTGAVRRILAHGADSDLRDNRTTGRMRAAHRGGLHVGESGRYADSH